MISGHRDVYKTGIRPATATACPGQYAYAWLTQGKLRAHVQKRIDDARAAAPPPGPVVSRVAADRPLRHRRGRSRRTPTPAR